MLGIPTNTWWRWGDVGVCRDAQCHPSFGFSHWGGLCERAALHVFGDWDWKNCIFSSWDLYESPAYGYSFPSKVWSHTFFLPSRLCSWLGASENNLCKCWKGLNQTLCGYHESFILAPFFHWSPWQDWYRSKSCECSTWDVFHAGEFTSGGGGWSFLGVPCAPEQCTRHLQLTENPVLSIFSLHFWYISITLSSSICMSRLNRTAACPHGVLSCAFACNKVLKRRQWAHFHALLLLFF